MYFTENLLIEAVYRHAREVILADQRKMNPLKQASLQALISVRQTVTGYAEDYFAFFLVLSIMEKKSRMIITASTKAELQEIVKPSVPHWNFGDFRTGPYHAFAQQWLLSSGRWEKTVGLSWMDVILARSSFRMPSLRSF